MSSERSEVVESSLGTLYRCVCGAVFAAESGLHIHEATCSDAAEEDEGRDGYTDMADKSVNVANTKNEDYITLVEWLDEATSHGTIDFKCRDIADEIDLTPKQIGVFMAAIDRSDETDYEVDRLAYTNGTHWEVSQG